MTPSMDRDPQRWNRVFELFESLLDLPGPERSRILDDSCADDPELRAAVEEMLAGHREVDDRSFLGRREQHIAIPTAPLESGLEGTDIGGFRLIRLIASGGMGAVFEASQENPARIVAVKVLKPMFASGSVLRRFEVEAEILARLRHPGIAQVFASGVHSFAQGAFRFDLPWYAMEFLGESQTLSEYVKERALTFADRLTLLRQICDAVEHAHQRGVIHRDLKPQNVLIDRHGTAKLIDFGIARDALRDGNTQHTLTGDVLGTPRYMAPEQLSGSTEVDVRTDVFALGVILYELLTDENPWAPPGAPIDEVRRRQRAGEPLRASSRAAGLPRELDWIVARALEREPTNRYPSVRELGEDLGRFLRREPTLASPPSQLHRARLFVARHRVGVAIAGIALAVNAAWIVNLKRARDRADDAQTLSERRLEFAQRQYDKIEEVIGVIEYSIDQANAVKVGTDVSMRDVLSIASVALDTHVERPEVGQALAASLAEWHFALHDFDQAEALARQAIAFGDATPPEFKDDLRQDNAKRVLAHCLAERGKLAEATALIENSRSSPTIEDTSVDTTARRVDHYFTIARNELLLAHYAAAEAAARAAITEIETTKMDPDGNINVVEISLIHALRGQNRLAEAFAVSDRIGKRIEGQPRFANAVFPAWRGQRACLLFDRGDLEPAHALAGENAQYCADLLSEDNKHTLSARQNLALIELALGHPKSALEHGNAIVEIRKRDGNPQSAELASAEQLVAWAQLDLGEFEAATASLERVKAATPEDFPDTHPFLGMTLALEGRLAIARGDRASGLEKLDRAFEIVDAGYGKGNRRASILHDWRARASEATPHATSASDHGEHR